MGQTTVMKEEPVFRQVQEENQNILKASYEFKQQEEYQKAKENGKYAEVVEIEGFDQLMFSIYQAQNYNNDIINGQKKMNQTIIFNPQKNQQIILLFKV